MADPNESTNALFAHGGYVYLRSYKVAEAVYDATVIFCARFVGKQTRTYDQMVQAARSGVRNISEGSGLAATSRTLEINLTNVARASLSDELRKDYESFLVQRGLRIWPKDAPEALAVRERLQQDTAPDAQPFVQGQPCLAGLQGLTTFIREADAEWAANTMLCAIHQAAYLLRRQVQQQARVLAQEGGFRERVKALQTQRKEKLHVFTDSWPPLLRRFRRNAKSPTTHPAPNVGTPPSNALPKPAPTPAHPSTGVRATPNVGVL